MPGLLTELAPGCCGTCRILKEREHPRGRYVPLDLVAMLDLQLREGGWGGWLFVAKHPASAPHMLRNVPHTVPRVGRSYEHFPDGFEFHLLPFSHYLQVIKRERETIIARFTVRDPLYRGA